MSTMAAVLTAVRNASGATTLTVGGTLTLTYSADGVASERGWNPPKHYTATYVPAPPAQVDLSGQQPQQAPAPVQQAAPAPAPAPVAAPVAAPVQAAPQATAPAPAPAAAPTEDQMAAFIAWQQSQQAG